MCRPDDKDYSPRDTETADAFLPQSRVPERNVLCVTHALTYTHPPARRTPSVYNVSPTKMHGSIKCVNSPPRVLNTGGIFSVVHFFVLTSRISVASLLCVYVCIRNLPWILVQDPSIHPRLVVSPQLIYSLRAIFSLSVAGRPAFRLRHY